MTRLICGASCALFLGSIGLAQNAAAPAAAPAPAATPAATAAPAGRGGAAAVRSPEILEDGKVTFRLRAPNATEVRMQPEPGATVPMVKGEDGVWSVTVGPWAPDVYAYRFVVDGVNMPDPANGAPLKSGRPNLAGEIGVLGSWQSELVVPNRTKPEPWEMTPIPHGAVAHVEFWSKTMGAYRDYFVYTPPGYDPKRAEPYPVLYLLHGAGENASGWTNNGRAHLILDSLIAEGKAVPMIMVMPLGHTAQDPRPGFAVMGEKPPAPAAPAAGATPAPAAGGNANPYFASLINEIMPQVETGYNAGKTKTMRAIAGLSMGGGQTFQIALANPDKFTYVGMFSAAVGGGGGGGGRGRGAATTTAATTGGAAAPAAAPAAPAPAAAPATPAAPAAYTLPAAATVEWGNQFKLLWIACGKDDGLLASNNALKAALKAKGIPHVDITTEGAHTFSVWKRNLATFAPLLFR